MKFLVFQNEDQILDYDFPVFNDDEGADEKILSRLRKMWRDMCNWRDNSDALVRLKVTTHLDNHARGAAALALNLTEFTRTITWHVNAYMPRAEGNAVISALFAKNCLSWGKTMEHIAKYGEVAPYLPSSGGIFSFHYYEPKEWSTHSMDTIANASEFIPFDVQDYSQICKAVRSCPVDCRPMVWVNPEIAKAFIAAQDSDINLATMQTYVSSFIINVALETEDDIDDRLIEQLWDGMRSFADSEDSQILVDLYKNAEKLLNARPKKAKK